MEDLRVIGIRLAAGCFSPDKADLRMAAIAERLLFRLAAPTQRILLLCWERLTSFPFSESPSEFVPMVIFESGILPVTMYGPSIETITPFSSVTV